MEAPDISGISEGIKNSTKANIEEQKTEKQVKPSCSVGISISDSPDLDRLGFNYLHIEDAMVEVARYLLANNFKLVYGGDLRKGGFTFIFSELAKQYSTSTNYNSFRVVNYFAWPVHINLLRIDDSEFKANNIQVVKLPPPKDVNVDPDNFIKPENLTDKVIWAKSLTYLRHVITETSEARILMGGQVRDYFGIVPGLVEEAIYSMRRKKQALYLCGTFGGATKAIIDGIMMQNNDALSIEFQRQNKSYKEFYNYWNATKFIKLNIQYFKRIK